MKTRDDGYSLIELLVAMTLTLMVALSIFALLTAGQRAFRREPERTVFELEAEYVGVLEAAHLAAADVERLAALELAHADAAGVR